MKCEMNDSWLLLGVMPFCLLSRNIWEGNDAKGSVEITEQHYQIHACMTNLSMSDSQEEKARQSFEKKMLETISQLCVVVVFFQVHCSRYIMLLTLHLSSLSSTAALMAWGN